MTGSGDDERSRPPVAGPPVDGAADEGGLEVPNCPACLERMTDVETEDGIPYWACGHCGQVRLA